MAKPRILVIEDDAAIRRGIVDALHYDGFTTIPPHWLVLRHRPQDMGLLPDGEPVEEGRPLLPPAGVTAEQIGRAHV